MEKTFSDAATKFLDRALEELEAEAYSEAISLAESACKLAGIYPMLVEVSKRKEEKSKEQKQ